MGDGDRRPNAPKEHVSFRIEPGTKLSESVAALSTAGVESDAVAGFALNTIEKARKLKKARGRDPFLGRRDPDAIICHRALGTALAKAALGEELNEREDLACSIIAAGLGLGEETFTKAREVKVPGHYIPSIESVADSALLKARIAEVAGTPVATTALERVAAAFVKAKHSTRHPQTGKFIPTASKPTLTFSTPTPGPDSDQFDGAPTNTIISGTGDANAAPSPTHGIWQHLGPNNLLA
jgi:hypothetical protein